MTDPENKCFCCMKEARSTSAMVCQQLGSRSRWRPEPWEMYRNARSVRLCARRCDPRLINQAAQKCHCICHCILCKINGRLSTPLTRFPGVRGGFSYAAGCGCASWRPHSPCDRQCVRICQPHAPKHGLPKCLGALNLGYYHFSKPL